MDRVQAVFQDGVFRPVNPVDLPEKTLVEFEPILIHAVPTAPSLDDVYDVLAARFNSGQTDIAARHNEHQP